MRLSTLLLFITLLSATLTSCVNTGSNSPISQQATVISRTFANQGQLNEGQYKRVRMLSIRMMREIDRMRLQTKSVEEEEVRAQAIQAAYETQLEGILMPNQVALVQPHIPNLVILRGQTLAVR